MAEIWLSGGVGWELTAQLVAEKLKELNGQDVIINLNTGGGSVYDGIEIYNVIKQYQGRKIIKLGSLVASAGTYIACAGDEVVAQDFTSFMIHEVNSWVEGTAEEIMAEAERVEKLNDLGAKRLSEKSGKTYKEIRSLMKEETWFYGQEIVDAGFADRLEDTGKAMEKTVAVAIAREQYKRVAMIGQRKETKDNDGWVDEARALIDSGNYNAVDDSDEIIRNGVVMRTALRRIVSRAANGKPEVANLISMIDKAESRKRGKRMDKAELIEAVRRENGLTLDEIAKALNQSERLMGEEHKNALSVMTELNKLGVKDPVAEIKANRARIEELSKAERSVALTNAFGASRVENGKELNLVREYAEERVPKNAAGEDLTKSIDEVKNSTIAKRLAGEMADPSSEVNRIETRENTVQPGETPVVEY
jgi:ATP-dependent protease ClpP protease subunit/predicted transcriptional regulator